MKSSKIYAWVVDSQIVTATALFLLITLVVVLLTGLWDSYSDSIFPNTRWGLYNAEFWQNVLVEAHGMLLDTFIIGTIILWLNKKREDKLEIRRYEDEINDFRKWGSEEAAYLIVRNIKRLNKQNITAINLKDCFLEKMDLSNVNLEGANLTCAKLKGCDLYRTNLKNANLLLADLEKAEMVHTNLEGAVLIGTNLKNVRIAEAMLQRATYNETAEFPDFLKSVEEKDRRGMVFTNDFQLI